MNKSFDTEIVLKEIKHVSILRSLIHVFIHPFIKISSNLTKMCEKM